jgi:hypothetical protein
VTREFKEAVGEVPESEWHPMYREQKALVKEVVFDE